MEQLRHYLEEVPQNATVTLDAPSADTTSDLFLCLDGIHTALRLLVVWLVCESEW